jgi:hypothetical protein
MKTPEGRAVAPLIGLVGHSSFSFRIMKTEVEPLTTGPSPTAAHHPTTAGNYFVSNYPPFSFWRPEAVGDFFAALERPPQP